MKPILKWVGGKRQLLKKILETIPKEFKNYHEPFVGGGAVFFDLLKKGWNIGSINDLNSELINLYKQVKNNVEIVISYLKIMEKKHSRLYYYYVRSWDRNKDYKKMNKAQKAARIIYLNKTAFNGIYRVNKKGYFNVPIGNPFGKKNILDENNLRTTSIAMMNSKIKIFNEDYKYVLNEASRGDVVYFDPPYDFFENGNNFVDYQKEGFIRTDQIELKKLCDNLKNNGVYVIVSNHNTNFIRKLYNEIDGYYTIEIVSANRTLNVKSDARGKKNIEVLIVGKPNE